MNRVEELRKQAEECRTRAAHAQHAPYRDKLLLLAKEWDHLANEHVKLLDTQDTLQVAV